MTDFLRDLDASPSRRSAPTDAPPPAAATERGSESLEVRTEPLGGTPLARAGLAGATPAGWYPERPRDVSAWRERTESVRRQFAAGAWLELLRPAMAAHGAAAARLERSAGGAGVVVTTGQQPGLFGGPLYAWTKAVSALALADALEAATGTPVAPVFWAATDDADFAEASRTVVARAGGADLLVARATAPEGTPMSAVPLGDDVPRLLARLAGGAGSLSYPPALDAAHRAYATGATVGGAYVALLRELLEPLGIAVLDASHPATREAGFHVLRRALFRAEELDRALVERGAQIAAAGFEPQVAPVAGKSLVFAQDATGRKERVPITDARARVASARAGDLGPNVLLRPVVERAILPTVAYLAGPGEFAYFAQVSAVAAALAADAPLAVARWSGTVLEPHVRRALARTGLAAEALAAPDAAEQTLAASALPDAVGDALAALRAGVEGGVARLAAVDEPRLVSARALDGARAQLRHRVDRLERRYLAAVKRRESDLMQAVGTARGALFPLGVRQERALNVLPMLARHGPALWRAMLERAREHAALLLGAGDAPGS
jgi:bacillithiol biosynthesis cysteine-adding enzyme BshC